MHVGLWSNLGFSDFVEFPATQMYFFYFPQWESHHDNYKVMQVVSQLTEIMCRCVGPQLLV